MCIYIYVCMYRYIDIERERGVETEEKSGEDRRGLINEAAEPAAHGDSPKEGERIQLEKP